MTSKTQTVGTVAKSVGYGYTNGNRTSLTTPSGQAVVYGYNTNDQVTSITVNGTTLLSGVSYDPFGPIKGWTWGNGTAMSRTFKSHAEARLAGWYNPHRRHSGIGRLSPNNFERRISQQEHARLS